MLSLLDARPISEAVQGAGRLQRGHALLGRCQSRARHVRRQRRRLADHRRHRGRGAEDLPGAEAGALSGGGGALGPCARRSEEHTSELQSLMRISYAVFCLKKKTYDMNKK